MNIARFLGASLSALAVLLLLNMFVFPFIFPSGVASKFSNTRPQPLVALHFAAFITTALLLTALCVVTRGPGSTLAAAGIGALAGLLTSLPSAFHTNALSHQPLAGEVSAVLWTTITWALATGAAHVAYWWHRAA
jgi:hypothetical protein